MNRRSFFKFLPAMPVAAVAAAKVMAEPKIEIEFDPSKYAEIEPAWKLDDWFPKNYSGEWIRSEDGFTVRLNDPTR